MPPTEETDGVYRGTVEIDGTAQQGVRMDEAYQLEEGEHCRSVPLRRSTKI